jgi:glucose/arabinose dehydrogenase
MMRVSEIALSLLILAVALGVAGCQTTDPIVVEESPRPEASTEATVSVVALEDIEVRLEPFAEGFDSPLYVTGTGDGSGRLIVLEKTGRAWELTEGERGTEPWLDLSDAVSTVSEQGLLGIAFPDGFAESGRFYIDYTDRSGGTVVSRFRVGGNGAPDPSSEQKLLEFEQPYSNHNGGMIEFGPDGMLYVGTGDGGSGGDPLGAGQRLDTLLGKMLRVQVEFDEGMHGAGDVDAIEYATPEDNPFISDVAALEEIWAYGLRNPWRFSFDRDTGDLWIGDVGQNAWEEIDFQPSSSEGGENYGWNVFEGTQAFEGEPNESVTYVMPIIEYDRAAGRSVTGGYVYRGSAYPALEGVYVYGDFVTGRIWGLRRSGDEIENRLLAETNLGIASFGEDDDGELYVVDLGGNILRLTAEAAQ